jgi:uncharacterized membrane protein YdjX (TVP38/TMEM64 family)
LKHFSSSKLSFPVLVGILLATIPMLTTSFLTAWAISYEDLLRSWPFYWWIWLTLGLTLTSAIALTPPTFLALVFGYFLSWSGLPLMILLNIGAISLVYFLANFFQPAPIRRHLVEVYPVMNKLIRRFQENQLRLIFFAKLSPVLPFAVTNIFFVVVGARLKQVLLGGTSGMIPRTILAIWAGSEARDIRYLLDHPNEGLFNKIVILVLIVGSTVGIGYFFKDPDTEI